MKTVSTSLKDTDATSEIGTLRRASIGVVAAVALLVSSAANAILVIEIDDLSNGLGVDFSVADGSAGDLNSFDGQVGVMSLVGGSFFGIAAGSGAPDVGELFDIQFDATVVGDWVIRISDDSFLLGDVDAVRATSLVTPTTIAASHEIRVQTFVDGQIVLDSALLESGINQAASELVNILEPTTIEHLFTLSSTGSGTSTFDTRTTTVSEPATLGLLGAGLIAFAWMRRKRAA